MRPLLLLFSLAIPHVAASQPVRSLGTSQKEHPFEFSGVSEIRELSDGKLIVVDRRARTIRLLDFARGTAIQIGRAGAGPKEVAQPTSLLALPGDTTAVWDGRNARLFYIGPDGLPLRTDRLVADGGAAITIDVRAPRYADGAGRLYFAGLPEGEGAARDSIPILRFDRRNARIDTVGTYLAPTSEPATVGPPGRQMTLALTNPFAPQQEWFVTREGRVGVVRSPEYRVDWTYPTTRRGVDVPFAAIALTNGDKDQWRRGQHSMVITRDANSRGAEPSTSMVPEPKSWPSHKPPFLGGGGSVLVDTAGRVWVLRTAEMSDPAITYDVFDAESRMVMQVRMPKHQRVVGFGRGVVYTTRADADDLLHVNRHVAPR